MTLNSEIDLMPFFSLSDFKTHNILYMVMIAVSVNCRAFGASRMATTFASRSHL